MIKGTIKFDGLTLATLNVDLTRSTLKDDPTGVNLKMNASAAFIDNKTGKTHGHADSEGTTWSKKTIEALRELCRCIEQDMAPKHLQEASEPEPSERGIKFDGLSEFLSEKEPPSI